MNYIRAFFGKSAVVALLFGGILCVLAPNAAADSSYGVNYSCDGVTTASPQQLVGNSSISFNCAGASGSTNMLTGASSVSASPGGFSATASWTMLGTVGGATGSTGTITLSDADITGVSANSGGSVSLGVVDWLNPSDASYGCFNVGGTDGCAPYGGLLSASLSVTAGEQIFLSFDMSCSTSVDDLTNGCSVSDPVSLSLSPGLTFDTTLPDFLSESATPAAATPEPSSLFLFGSGLLALGAFFRRGKLISTLM